MMMSIDTGRESISEIYSALSQKSENSGKIWFYRQISSWTLKIFFQMSCAEKSGTIVDGKLSELETNRPRVSRLFSGVRLSGRRTEVSEIQLLFT